MANNNWKSARPCGIWWADTCMWSCAKADIITGHVSILCSISIVQFLRKNETPSSKPEFFDWKFDERDLKVAKDKIKQMMAHNTQHSNTWTIDWKIAFVIGHFIEFKHPFGSTLLPSWMTCIVSRTFTNGNLKLFVVHTIWMFWARHPRHIIIDTKVDWDLLNPYKFFIEIIGFTRLDYVRQQYHCPIQWLSSYSARSSAILILFSCFGIGFV